MTICSWGAIVASPAMNTPGKLVGPFALMTISPHLVSLTVLSWAEVEESPFAHAAFHLQADTQCPDALALERRFLPDDLGLVPRLAMNGLACGSRDGPPPIRGPLEMLEQTTKATAARQQQRGSPLCSEDQLRGARAGSHFRPSTVVGEGQLAGISAANLASATARL
jgi:hypothetical protein